MTPWWKSTRTFLNSGGTISPWCALTGKIGDGQVAVSAWGVLDKMDGVDRERIMRFFEHYVGRLGPEGAISCRGTQASMPGS